MDHDSNDVMLLAFRCELTCVGISFMAEMVLDLLCYVVQFRSWATLKYIDTIVGGS